MSAYLLTLINGNQDFGGYLSVDGEKAIAIKDDMTYELSPGQHSLEIFSTSDAKRNVGKMQANILTRTSSSGVIGDAMEIQSTLSNLGDSWTIDVVVEDGQMITLSVVSKGSKLVGNPLYKVDDLTEEAIKELEEKFEAWKNTPIRSKKQIVWGLILAFCGAFGFMNYITGENKEDLVQTVAVMGGLFGIGLLLFILGMRKKVRRK